MERYKGTVHQERSFESELGVGLRGDFVSTGFIGGYVVYLVTGRDVRHETLDEILRDLT